MLIPQGDWIVVVRAFRDVTGRGQIRKQGLTEADAKYIAAQEKEACIQAGLHIWAMHKSDY